MIGEMGKRKPLHEVASVSDPMLEGSKFCTHPENAWFLRHEAVLEDRILTTANITECYEKLLFEEVHHPLCAAVLMFFAVVSVWCADDDAVLLGQKMTCGALLRSAGRCCAS